MPRRRRMILNTHLWNAIRYVECNPVRGGLVGKAEDCVWSSAPAHCGFQKDRLLDPAFPPTGLISDWSNWLAPELPDSDLEKIRSATWKGIPYASRAFTEELESLLGLNLLPIKQGRPKEADHSAQRKAPQKA